MLDIYFDDGTADLDNVIINPMKYFDFKIEPKWLNDEFVRKMILEIDDAKVIQDEFIMNNEGRAITPFHLSGGVKTLICIYEMPDKFWYGSTMGDNCCNNLAEIARKQDIKILLRHFMDIPYDCEDVLCVKGRKVTIEEYEDAYCAYCEVIRERMKEYE